MLINKMIERIPLDKLCERYDLNVCLSERSHILPGNKDRFYAYLDGVENKSGCILESKYSDGSTPKEAVLGIPAVYNNLILITDAMSKTNRREFGPFVILPPSKEWLDNLLKEVVQ